MVFYQKVKNRKSELPITSHTPNSMLKSPSPQYPKSYIEKPPAHGAVIHERSLLDTFSTKSIKEIFLRKNVSKKKIDHEHHLILPLQGTKVLHHSTPKAQLKNPRSWRRHP